MRPLLIGQAPGPNTRPDLPLYPLPRASAGGKLQALTGLTRGQYLRTFDRVNLIYEHPGRTSKGNNDKLSIPLARASAWAMRPLLNRRTVVYVGREVANAFHGGECYEWLEWRHSDQWGYCWAALPHPSGRNHWYNQDDNRERAEFFLQALLKIGAGVCSPDHTERKYPNGTRLFST